MQIEINEQPQRGFKPISLTITFESTAEIKAYMALINNRSDVMQLAQKHIDADKDNEYRSFDDADINSLDKISSFEIWETLNSSANA